ncbi:UNKNOWN [Stylonychia lemnae]|uniref:Uncharacterized protein n=1 Tax=Stylonychia lemnae TaxID=5949 RepID=A0A078A763_STYLE|nr:UNKNOWN [Stylonychia lemnae]|eukprot:CDW78089.1 UNKNOWN [Stylonychia lemnae]
MIVQNNPIIKYEIASLHFVSFAMTALWDYSLRLTEPENTLHQPHYIPLLQPFAAARRAPGGCGRADAWSYNPKRRQAHRAQSPAFAAPAIWRSSPSGAARR